MIVRSSIAELILFHSLLLLLASTPLLSSASSPISRPNCEDKCGDIPIPYPFGFGNPDCFRPGFEIICDNTLQQKKPFILGNRTTYAYNNTTDEYNSKKNYSQYEIFNISVENQQLTVYNLMDTQCYQNATTYTAFSLDDGGPYLFSDDRNLFTVIGCYTLAYITGYNSRGGYYAGICMGYCEDQTSIRNGPCDGTGCCQIRIPRDLTSYTIYFDRSYNSQDIYEYSPCGYAFLADETWYSNFTAADLKYDYGNKNQNKPRTVLDWAIRDEKTCEDAKANANSYACVSTNSECFDVSSGYGYICNCSQGYAGNPYQNNGCKDIIECDYPEKYPCSGKCVNTDGSYICKNKFPLAAKLAIGIGVAAMVVIFIVFLTILSHVKKKHKQEKDMFFKQNGGLILFEKLKSKQVDTITIFNKEELEKATNDFKDDVVIGRGGRGMVYKGILEDNRVVAIKKSKVVDEDQKEEFVNEMIILSQINHRNVVKLLGCCFEVDVPMLVYEFVSKGSLYDNLHKKRSTPPLNLRRRLGIAAESAEALAYLHYGINRSIVHGDVKSQNILINDKFNAKVSDFGASQLVPRDEAGFLQFVQGTLGYLDPECLITRKLTDKSDVYSFGVLLVELITGKMAIYTDDSGQKQVLSQVFIEKMKENMLRDILDAQILEEGEMEIVQEIAKIAKHCMGIKGEERPPMRDVAERLHSLMNKCKNYSHARNNISEDVQSVQWESGANDAVGGDANTTTADFNSVQIGIALNIEGGR